MSSFSVFSPVQYLKGVGPRRAVHLKRAGIETVFDLLCHFPKRYEDRRVPVPVDKMADGQVVWTQGRVLGGSTRRIGKGRVLTKLALKRDGLVFYATWFNQPYLLQKLVPGTAVAVVGRCSRRFQTVNITVSEYETEEADGKLSTGRIVPVYALTEGLNQKTLRALVRTALDTFRGNLPEPLPNDLLVRYDLPSVDAAFANIHYPPSFREADAARRRLVYEECFLFQLALQKMRVVGEGRKEFRHGPDGPKVSALLNSFPYRLTAAQERVWSEISSDMQQAEPMRRLLQGDVGSGKTIIALLALVKCVEAGLQGAFMVPTEILAEQHYRRIKKMLRPLDIQVDLLTGHISSREREQVLARLQEGSAQIIVGTHALIQESVQFSRLGLIVIDEQHRFGVRQRMMLQEKGAKVDSLMMTATPIPRTLALTVYGDLDVSVIDELPPGRRPVSTHLVYPVQLPRVYRFILREVGAGRQAYIICPLIEESEQLQNEAAVKIYEELRTGPLRDVRVGLLHGRMSGDEKMKVISGFTGGEVDVLVATTVVEVGVDVPNATIMVIFDAERFGLAQLHQLRGRVGRGGEQSWCILVGDPTTEEAKERLQAIVQSNDGFRLAETDLRLRGPGEFLGTRQAGLPGFKITDLMRDWKIMEMMQREARQILAADPDLDKPEYRILRSRVEPLVRKLSL